MAEREQKFTVINVNHLNELNDIFSRGSEFSFECQAVKRLRRAVENFVDIYEGKTGRRLNNKYIVCNQDEPYADKVWQVILDGEDAKAAARGEQEKVHD